jgi:hypothetical protein
LDWQAAITRNRDALITIIAALMKSLGLVQGGVLTTLPRHLYRKALFIIRPAEAAVRRLIMMAAYEMELRGIKPRQPRATDERYRTSFPNPINFAPSFNLIDPLKLFGEEAPDYACFGPAFNDERGPADRTPLPAASLGRRLLALKHALDNVQKQARRLTRWYAIRDAALKARAPHRLSPLRPGFPPGYRRKPVHEVEEVLLDCHSFAQYARERRDSS